jgi:membrane-bound lytic murein transglycosylase A
MRSLFALIAAGFLVGCVTTPSAPPATPAVPVTQPSTPFPEPPRATPAAAAPEPCPEATTPTPSASPAPAAIADPVPQLSAPQPALPSAPPATAPSDTAPAASQANEATSGLQPASNYPWLQTAAWKDLPGWKSDNLAHAWPAWLRSCQTLQKQRVWQALCDEARQLPVDTGKLRNFFEQRFQPYQVNQTEGGQEGLVTGYYEPLLRGSKSFSPAYPYPLLAPPDDLLVVDLAEIYPELKHLRLRGRLQGNKVVPYYSRADIETGRTPLKGREIAWVADPIELFFLQVQGSGRLQLDNGEMMRIGYADQNGHPYKSIGKWLVEQGELTLDKASMQGIKDWGARNPEKLPRLLQTNPSFVFFRELPNLGDGPIGSQGVPLTPERSIAVDPRAVPLGAPVWLATTQPNSSSALQRLMIAQDTGSAIKGNVRADFFWGFGDAAGAKAGAMKQPGRMWLLLPKDLGNGRKNGL